MPDQRSKPVMRDGLYHRDIGFPATGWTGCRIFALKYSRHATRAAINDRYGPLELSQSLKVTWDQIVEAEVASGLWSKFVVRVVGDNGVDLVYVINPDGLVRTVWGNLVTDDHGTLNRGRYNKVTCTEL